MVLKCVKVPTKPFDGQQPGTSGLRKPTKVFMGQHYTENFVQCILSSMGDKLAGSTLVVGGDGRYYGKEATEKIIQMCAANKVHNATNKCWCCWRHFVLGIIFSLVCLETFVFTDRKSVCRLSVCHM